MSMAISRISASGVASMMYGMPVNRPSRVAKVDSGDRANIVVAGTSSQAVQSISGSQSDTSGTADQVQAAFQYARAGLSSMVATSSTSMTQASSGEQAGRVHQVAASGRPVGHTPRPISRWDRPWILLGDSRRGVYGSPRCTVMTILFT